MSTFGEYYKGKVFEKMKCKVCNAVITSEDLREFNQTNFCGHHMLSLINWLGALDKKD